MNLCYSHDGEPSRKRHDEGIHHNIYGGYLGRWAVSGFYWFSVLKKARFYKFIKKKNKTPLLILLKVKVRNEGIFQALI